MSRGLRALQPAAPLSQQAQRHAHVPSPQLELLTETEAARVCRYFDRGCTHPVRAFQKWARRAGVPVKTAGRARLYDPRVLDAFLNRDDWTTRHAGTVAPALVSRQR